MYIVMFHLHVPIVVSFIGLLFTYMNTYQGILIKNSSIVMIENNIKEF